MAAPPKLPVPVRAHLLHSMTSVLPNGGAPPQRRVRPAQPVALDDVSATEWRTLFGDRGAATRAVALDDVSATEWRQLPRQRQLCIRELHSMMSVLPNGGSGKTASGATGLRCTR